MLRAGLRPGDLPVANASLLHPSDRIQSSEPLLSNWHSSFRLTFQLLDTAHCVRASVNPMTEEMTMDVAQRIEQESESLKTKDPRQRLAAVRALGRAARALPLEERKGIVDHLAGVALDPEPFIRWNVAIALGEIGNEAALRVLERMASDEHANVRFRVAQALGFIGDVRGIAILERYVEDSYKVGEHAPVRAFAAIALGMIGHPDAVPLLARLARDTEPTIRWHAAVALGDVGSPAGLEALKQLMSDPVPFTRAHTAIACAEIGDAAGLPIVERVAKDDVPRVAAIAQGALKSLQECCAPGCGPETCR